ncbi:hypothetical protein [Arthrospiribacter ruber]|uniref:Uncharacterized protein n=1 Tax=Arthrospiribacter ruber TaxID=2487934 RepID=A0A951MCG1_9BACT|nr:hypothetical protein [Arthrospiribacter ruber]MBW3466341.1 hypothetical protein [Arthrospiribacter ruber]
MKAILIAILTCLTVLLVGKIAPYWVLMVLVGFWSLIINPRPWTAFFIGGLAFGLSWFVLTIWISIQSESALPSQMADLMGVKNDNLLWVATAVLGFLIGGFSSMTGSLFRRITEKRDSGIYRS